MAVRTGNRRGRHGALRRGAACTPYTLALLFGTSPAATTYFDAPFVAYETDQVPVAVDAGDLNGDGYPDLVSANVRRGNLNVFLGTGDGKFGPRQAYGTSVGPRALALGDVDGDGKLDAVAACYVRSVVTLLHGAGDGSFDTYIDIATGVEPKAVGLDDFDGDHVPDLLTLNSGYNFPPGSFTLRFGNGDGTFGERREFSTGGIASSYGAADMDGDGNLDLVVANASPNEVTTLFGDGAGNFGRPEHAALAGTPTALCVGDWNHDGRPDVAVYNDRIDLGTWVRRIAVFTGQPGGSLAAAGELFAISFLSDLESGDVDGDGDIDLVAQGVLAAVYPGDGAGHFDLPRPYEVGALPADLYVGDLDVDGKPDLAVAAMDSQALSVLLGNGDGTFGLAPVSTGPGPQSVALHDMDGDGDLDLAVAAQTNRTVVLHTGAGDGTFATRRDLSITTKLASVAAGDLNGDTRPDLATVSFDEQAGGTLSVLLANPAGGYFPHADLELAAPATCVVLGDWNDDGKLDAAASEWTAPYPGDCGVEVFLGDGAGGFEPGVLHGVGPMPMGLTSGDVDADGDLDLVASYRRAGSSITGGVSVLRGDGQGGFAPQRVFETGNEPRGVAIGDLNGDDLPEIVVANSNYSFPTTGSIAVLHGLGEGMFALGETFAAGVETFGLVLGDWDADGWLDVAAANATSNTVTMYRGQGDGTFVDRIDFGTGFRPLLLARGDVDGDGKPDLVAANSFGSTATLLLNRTVATPVWVEELAAESGTDGVRLAWRLAPDAVTRLRGVHVERADERDGPYTTLTRAALQPAREMHWLDPTAGSVTSAWYRLQLESDLGGIAFVGPVRVERGLDARLLALEAPRRNGDDAFDIRYHLGTTTSDLRLVVVDVAGRRLRTLAQGGTSSGAHQCSWDRRDDAGRRLARGVYWVHLSADGRGASRKIVVSRP